MAQASGDVPNLSGGDLPSSLAAPAAGGDGGEAKAGEGSRQCPLCGHFYTDQFKTFQHMWKSHEADRNSLAFMVAQESLRQQYPDARFCRMCDSWFVNVRSLFSHYNRKHKVHYDKLSQARMQDRLCEMCEEILETKIACGDHIATAHGVLAYKRIGRANLRCRFPECMFDGTSAAALYEHWKEHAGLWKCKVCHHTFPDFYNWDIHKRDVHPQL